MLRHPRLFRHLTHATVPGYEEPIKPKGRVLVPASRLIDCEGEDKDTSESAVDPSAWMQHVTCC